VLLVSGLLIFDEEAMTPLVPPTDTRRIDGRVKELSSEVAPPDIEETINVETTGYDASTGSREETVARDIGTDPTIAHAGLTELEDIKLVHGNDEVYAGPGQAGIDEGAANAAATINWESNASSGVDGMQDSWVSVPRPADETEMNTTSAATNDTNNTGNTAAGWGESTPPANGTAPTNVPLSVNGAAPVNGTSWADDVPEAPANDGFHEVSHRASRGRAPAAQGRGGQEKRGGRRPRGGDRGRGSHRGRGRGGIATES
jgi:hypothetical protein